MFEHRNFICRGPMLELNCVGNDKAGSFVPQYVIRSDISFAEIFVCLSSHATVDNIETLYFFIC